MTRIIGPKATDPTIYEAVGVWTLKEAQDFRGENTWPRADRADIEWVVVAGGGAGGQSYGGGGGGGGGFRTSYGTSGAGSSAEANISAVVSGVLTITVGAGGAAAASTGYYVGSQGSPSAIANPGFTTISSVGGGRGGSYGGSTESLYVGGPGGSGGGAAGRDGWVEGTSGGSAGGAATSNQGLAGGSGGTGWRGYYGGGGGGSSEVGTSSTHLANQNVAADPGVRCDGGDGQATTISGSSVSYAGGGGGGVVAGSDGTPGNGVGGAGGGATATTTSANTDRSGTVNTGGGGAGPVGSVSILGGVGGSGIVVLRVLTSAYSGTTTGSPTVSTDSSHTVLTYTSSGTYTA